MNVGFVVHRFSASEGTGGYVVQLVKGLAESHEVTVYAAELAAPLPPGVRFVPVPALRRPASATIVSFPAGFARRRGRHDVLHAQGWVTTRADVVTAHIVLAAWRRAARAARVRPPLGERLTGWWVARRERALFRSARLVIAPSARAREEIEEVSGRTGSTRIVPHGFPAPSTPDQPAARRELLLPGGFLALFAGDARKGLGVALEALAHLPDARLAVASFSRADPWLERARRLGVRGRVHWLGPQTGMAAAYAAADVLVHPTPYDTFGLVVAEAMAAGRPAIVTERAGITELFDDRAGWVVGGDPLAGTVRAWREAEDRVERQRRGAVAREVAARRPWGAVVAETLTAYQSIA